MTPTELRRAATDLLNDVGCAHAYKELANHILSTVRDDDNDEPTPEFAESIGAPPGRWRYGPGKECRLLLEYELTTGHTVTIKTRGQLRRLIEGLGVPTHEK